jgi:hypothetical protein
LLDRLAGRAPDHSRQIVLHGRLTIGGPAGGFLPQEALSIGVKLPRNSRTDFDVAKPHFEPTALRRARHCSGV